MCNLYSVTTNQEAIRRLFVVADDRAGNLPPLSAVFPDPLPLGQHLAAQAERPAHHVRERLLLLNLLRLQRFEVDFACLFQHNLLLKLLLGRQLERRSALRTQGQMTAGIHQGGHFR